MGIGIRGIAAFALSSLLAGCAATQATVAPAHALRRLEENRTATFRIDTAGGHGSGAVVAADERSAIIVTCAHVVEGEKAVTITIVDPSGKTATVPATILAMDAKEDLAVIHVSAGPFQTVTFAKDGDARPGDRIYNVGYPYDMGEVVGRGYVMQTGMTGAYFDGEKVEEIRESLLADIPDGSGTSGSGVYLERTGDLVGIMQIATEQGEGPVSVRAKVVITVKRIRAFLDAQKIPYRTAE